MAKKKEEVKETKKPKKAAKSKRQFMPLLPTPL